MITARTQQSSVPEGPSNDTPDRPWTLLVVGFGVAVGPLDSACNIAFPAITAAFDVPVTAIQWVVISYVLTYASLLLGLGRLGDLVGHRRLFVVGLIWCAVALGLCAMARSFPWLLAARVLQGVGAAMILSSGPALATLSVPVARRSYALGLYMLAFSFAYAAGPIIGALLIERWGWPAVYWFRVPIALLSAVVALLVLRGDQARREHEPFDASSAVALAFGLACLLLFLALVPSARIDTLVALPLLLTGLVGMSLFVLRSSRSASPLINLALFRSRAFCAINLAHVLGNLAHFVVFLLVPFFLVNLHAVPVALSGVLIAQQPIGMCLAAPLAGWLMPRFGAPTIAIGGVVVSAAGLGLVATWDDGTPSVYLAITLAAQGFGHGLFQVASIDSVMARLGRRHQGVGGSLDMLTRTAGVVLGAAGASMLFGHWSGVGGDFLSAFHKTFYVASCVALLAAGSVVLALWLPSSRAPGRKC